MRHLFLVDTENIGPWNDFLGDAKKSDKVILFYSPATPAVPVGVLDALSQQGVKLEFVACAAGHNAMDFQLSTMLGALIATQAAPEYVIISADTGYDPIINFWKNRGITISRVPQTESMTQKLVQQAEASKDGHHPDDELKKTYKQYLYDVGIKDPSLQTKLTDILYNGMSQSAAIRKNCIYKALLKLFGQTKGINIYHQIQPVINIIIGSNLFPANAAL